MINLVLGGGAGKRLWPLSAGKIPKQFIKFGSEDSLYIKTIKRNLAVCDKTVVSTDQKYSDKADKQVHDAGLKAELILEPSCKGTAASIMIACLMFPDETLLVTPADHEIQDETAYNKAVLRARELAEEGHIVVFGIEPERPETRFGYICADGEDVKGFHEKPDLETAEKYVKDGCMVNSGMICFKSCMMISELIKFHPDQMLLAKTVYDNIRSGRATHRLCGRFMGQMQNQSIDKAVLEKSERLKCVKGIRQWRDVGTYDSIYDHRKSKEGANLSLNIGESFGCADFVDCKGSMVLNMEQDVVVCGLDDVIVVECGGKILAKKGTDITEAMRKLDG